MLTPKPCRINGISNSGDVIDGAQHGNNIFALQDAGIDIQGIISNAQSCTSGNGGGAVDFEDFLSMDNTDSLPSCMFNFRVRITAL